MMDPESMQKREVMRKLRGSHWENRRDTSWLLWNLIVFQYWYSTDVDTLS